MLLIKRNLLMFFRDKANVFFSLLSVIIIIGLYVLFLGDLMVEGLNEALGFDAEKAGVVMASITLAGMTAAISVTSAFGALGVCIADKEKAARDFYTSPVSRRKITLGYITGTAVVGLLMTFAALTLCLVYIAVSGGGLPGARDFAKLLLTAVLSVLCGNSMMYFIAVFVKSRNAFSSLSAVVGTLIGFLMGIYIPIGMFPAGVQLLIKCFPMSHAASMFRQVLADGELGTLFAYAPPAVLEEFREVYGIVFTYGGYTSGFWFSAGVLAVTAAVFYTASLIAARVRGH